METNTAKMNFRTTKTSSPRIYTTMLLKAIALDERLQAMVRTYVCTCTYLTVLRSLSTFQYLLQLVPRLPEVEMVVMRKAIIMIFQLLRDQLLPLHRCNRSQIHLITRRRLNDRQLNLILNEIASSSKGYSGVIVGNTAAAKKDFQGSRRRKWRKYSRRREQQCPKECFGCFGNRGYPHHWRRRRRG